MKICLNGNFLLEDEAKISVQDHGFLYGDGVYETMRTYKGKVCFLNQHLHRLKMSTENVALLLPFSFEEIGEQVSELLRMNSREGAKDFRLRITLTRGNNGFHFGRAKEPTFLITAHPLIGQPVQVYEQGVDVVLLNFERILPPVKSTSLISLGVAQRACAEHNAYEALLVNRSRNVTEGSYTNLFIVRDDVLYSPGEDILPGIMRESVIRLAKKIGRKVDEGNVTCEQLFEADEIFLTNVVRGVIPVRSVYNLVDDEARKYTALAPGPVTQEFLDRMDEIYTS